MPHRIRRQRKRAIPDGAVYVGRPTPFGNPFLVERVKTTGGLLRWYIADPCLGPNDSVEYFATSNEARARAVQLYRDWLDGTHKPWNGQESISQGHSTYVPSWVREQTPLQLAGRDLVCWCPITDPCHADVLLALANPTGK